MKGLDAALADGNYEKVEKQLIEISNSLIVSKITLKYVSGLLNAILPLTCHENLKLRIQAENVLYHINSIVSGFAPGVLLEAYQGLESVSTLQPAAQAAIFNCFANAMRFVAPSKRVEYIGTCHCMLMGSLPSALTRVTMDVWKMLRTELSLKNVTSVVKYLLNSSLPGVVSFFCTSNPGVLLPIVVEQSTLQFLKEFVQEWPKDKHIEATVIGGRLLSALSSESYSDLSTSIEIVGILLKRRVPFRHEIETWRNILITVESRWEAATVSHRAAIIDLFCSATKFGLVSLKDLNRFLVYDNDFPVVYQAAVIHVSTVFVCDEKIPDGMLEYYEKKAIDRDPILFIELLKSLAKTFNFLYRVRPNTTRKILELCIDPLPQYFVEQVHLIRLIRHIEYEGRSFVNLSNLVSGLLVDPNPAVLEELTQSIHDLKVEVSYSNLDWFENAPAYLSVLHKVSPSFVIELLDAEIIPLAAFPSAAESIMANEDLVEVTSKLLPRAVSLLFAGIKLLSFDISSEAKSLYTFGEKCSRETKDLLEHMLQVTDQNLPDTTFGALMEACLKILDFTLLELNLSFTNLIGLIDICCLLGVAFTDPCSRIISKVLEIRNNQEIRKRIMAFFTLPLEFESAESVCFAAVSSMTVVELMNVIDYIEAAAEMNREYLFVLYFITDDVSTMPVHRTFLGLRQYCPEYVERCAKELPFSEWELIQDDDEPYFEKLHNHEIKIDQELDSVHASWTQKFPDAFYRGNDWKETATCDDLVFPLNMTTFLESDIGSSRVVSNSDTDDIEPEVAEPVPFDPYHFKSLSRIDLFCFLWFSRRTCNSWDDIEGYAMRHSSDVRLVAGFFAYAHRMSMTVNIVEWPSKIRVYHNNSFSLVSVALYFKLVKSKWDDLLESQKSLIQRVLVEFGIEDDSEFSLMKFYYSSAGLRKMVISSIIEIDTSRFEESPVITSLFDSELELEGKLEDLLEILKSGPNEMVFNIMSNRWFPVLEVSEFEHITYPEDVNYCHSFMKAKIGVTKLEKVVIPEHQIDSLLNFMEHFGTINNFLCHVLSNAELTELQHLRLMRLLWPGNPLYCQALATRVSKSNPLAKTFPQFVSNHISLLQDFAQHKPPSYSRQLLKLILGQSLDSKKLVDSIAPVFYELLFDGYDIDHRFIDLRFPRPVDYEQFQAYDMRNLFAASHYRLHVIVETLFEFDNDRLCELFHSTSHDLAVLELAATFVACLKSERRYLFDTIYVTNAILKRASIESLMSIFMSDEFLNNGDVKDVYIILKLYLRHLRKTEMSEELVQMMIENKVQDSLRRELIQNENVEEGLAQILSDGL